MAGSTHDDAPGRGLLAPVTVVLEGDADDADPRRASLRAWLAGHPRPTGRDLARAGLVAPHWPEPWGLGADVDHQLVIDEELAPRPRGAPDQPDRHRLGRADDPQAGTPEQRQRWLPGILSGEEFWCQLFSEPDAGSDLASLTTTATLDGDEWVVTGQKVWTSYAHLSRPGGSCSRAPADEGAPQSGLSLLRLPDGARPGSRSDPSST